MTTRTKTVNYGRRKDAVSFLLFKTNWVVRFVDFFRNHPSSGRAHTSSRPRPLTKAARSKSHFVMATIFCFFSMSMTSSRGLIPLNQIVISQLFECWYTHSWDIKSNHSECPFRRSAAVSFWKLLSHFSMAGWPYIGQVPCPLVPNPPRFLSYLRVFVWTGAESTSINALFVINTSHMRFSTFQFVLHFVAATCTCSTSSRPLCSCSADSAIRKIKSK